MPLTNPTRKELIRSSFKQNWFNFFMLHNSRVKKKKKNFKLGLIAPIKNIQQNIREIIFYIILRNQNYNFALN